MAFTITLYKFDKRVNSTKLPTGGTNITIQGLKYPTSIYQPVFLLSNVNDDYNYVKWGSRYYWVNNVIRTNATQCEYHCSFDELATLRSNIFATSAFVLYSSSTSNPYCLDPRIPTDKSVAFEGGAILSLENYIDSVGTYIVGCVGQNGIQYYGLTPAQLTTLAGQITAATSSDVDTAFLNKFGNLIDCITSVYWVPIATSAIPGATDTVYLGSYSTGITAKIAPTLGWVLVPDTALNLSYIYDGLNRRNCNERISLFLPAFGNVDLQPSAIGYEDKIYVEATFDVQGNLCYRLKVIHGSIVIWTSIYPCSIGVEVPFGKSVTSFASAVANFARGEVDSLNTGLSNFMSKHPKISSITNKTLDFLAGDVTDSATQMLSEIIRIGSNAVTTGGFSGAAGARMLVTYPQIYLIVSSFGYCESQNNMNTLYGRPVNKVMSLQNLSGFCQCMGASVSGNWPDYILNSVSAQLNSGIYLE